MRRYCPHCLSETPERGLCRCLASCPKCDGPLEQHGDTWDCYTCAERVAIRWADGIREGSER